MLAPLCFELLHISIHALREEGDAQPRATAARGAISIHALREEGDTPKNIGSGRPFDFYPRPPRGGRPDLADASPVPPEFLSTPSARRATGQRLHEGAGAQISIHALREEGDANYPALPGIKSKFLSTPSARRATFAS